MIAFEYVNAAGLSPEGHLVCNTQILCQQSCHRGVMLGERPDRQKPKILVVFKIFMNGAFTYVSSYRFVVGYSNQNCWH